MARVQKTFKHVRHIYGESKNLASSPSKTSDPWLNQHIAHFKKLGDRGRGPTLYVYMRKDPQNEKMYQVVWFCDKHSHKSSHDNNWFGFVHQLPMTAIQNVIDQMANAIQQNLVVRNKNKYTIKDFDWWLEQNDYDANELQILNEDANPEWTNLLTPFVDDMRIFGNSGIVTRDKPYYAHRYAFHTLLMNLAIEQVKVLEDIISSTYVEPTVEKPTKKAVVVHQPLQSNVKLKQTIIDKEFQRVQTLCNKLKVQPVDYLHMLQEVIADQQTLIAKPITIVE